jgi:hypothetical protein
MRDGRTAADVEPGAKIIPKGDAELPAGLGEPEKCIAAVATDVAVGSAADVAFWSPGNGCRFRSHWWGSVSEFDLGVSDDERQPRRRR